MLAVLRPFIVCYRSPTKLGKGNVFSCVCLSFCLFTGGPYKGPWPLSPPHHTGTPSTPTLSQHIQICGTWTSPYRDPPPPSLEMFKFVCCVAHTFFSKQAVGIRLKCLPGKINVKITMTTLRESFA